MSIRQDTLRERWFASNNYSPTTECTYRDTLVQFQRRYPCHAERVTPAMLVDFLTTDADGQPTSRAPSTLKRQRATLCGFWRWANRNGYVKTNPADSLGEVRLGSGQRRAGRWLTADDAIALLAACHDGTDQGTRDHALVATAVLTGLRRAELAGLRWRDIDLANSRLAVKGKGSKLATVGLPGEAAQALRCWRETVIAHIGRNPRPNDPVFCTGRPVGGLHNSERSYTFDWRHSLSLWGIRSIIARRAELASLGVVATHDLRRTFAGLLDEQGVDLGGIQAALRHGSPDVTAQCYLDHSPRRAVRAVSDLKLAPSTNMEAM